MEIKIGVRDIGRELTVDTDQSPEQIEKQFRSALAEGGLLTIDAAKGRRVLLPVAQIGYIDLGSANTRQVGFGFGNTEDES